MFPLTLILVTLKSFIYALLQFLLTSPNLKALLVEGIIFPLIEVSVILELPPPIKSSNPYDTSPFLKKILLFPETSNNKFLPSYGLIVKLSPLIDVIVLEYIFQDLLFGLKLCKLIIKL